MINRFGNPVTIAVKYMYNDADGTIYREVHTNKLTGRKQYYYTAIDYFGKSKVFNTMKKAMNYVRRYYTSEQLYSISKIEEFAESDLALVYVNNEPRTFVVVQEGEDYYTVMYDGIIKYTTHKKTAIDEGMRGIF